MKLSQWAKKQGISYRTAHSWFKAGQIPNAYQMETGTIIINDSKIVDDKEDRLEKLMLEMIELLVKIEQKIK